MLIGFRARGLECRAGGLEVWLIRLRILEDKVVWAQNAFHMAILSQKMVTL